MSEPSRTTNPRRWVGRAVIVATTLPGGATAALLATDRLGANPIEAALNDLGWWTLTLLLATLACSPLKALFGWNWPLRLRRPLGVAAFVYGVLHFLTYAGPDQGLDLPTILEDITKRKFITVGFVALVLMLPLAVTSTNKMVKRLGFPRWKRLHRLAYVAAALGVLHFLWRVKADYTEPLVFTFVLLVLFAVRVFARVRSERRPVSPSPSSGRGVE